MQSIYTSTVLKKSKFFATNIRKKSTVKNTRLKNKNESTQLEEVRFIKANELKLTQDELF